MKRIGDAGMSPVLAVLAWARREYHPTPKKEPPPEWRRFTSNHRPDAYFDASSFARLASQSRSRVWPFWPVWLHFQVPSTLPLSSASAGTTNAITATTARNEPNRPMVRARIENLRIGL